MKRLYIMVMGILMLFMGFTFAADFDISLTPNSQNAISGTIVQFDVSVTSNTGVDTYIVWEVPYPVEYINSNVVPYNNPALILGLENNPKWLLSSGQTLNIHIEGLLWDHAFYSQNVVFDIEDINTNYTYDSGSVMLEPIADLIVRKTLVGASPQFTGDAVMFNIQVENIGSKLATGISLVDVWPDSLFTFSNQGLVDGVSVVPTIYNGLSNNYLFSISNLPPFAISNVEIEGYMDTQLPALYEFENSVFVFSESNEYDISNNNVVVTGNVIGDSDLIVEILQLSTDPVLSGDLISYLIKYQNIGFAESTGIHVELLLSSNIDFVSSTPMYSNQLSGGEYKWVISSLMPSQSGYINVTGVFLGNYLSGGYSGSVVITPYTFDSNYSNNTSVSTGEMQYISDMSVKLYANNLTDPSRNFDTGTQIFAISGDVVELQIVIENNGNQIDTGSVSISNISSLVDYNGVTTWAGVLPVGASHIILFTGTVGPQNFVTFTPVANLTYAGILKTDDVEIDEPLTCGDGLLTQTEVCDVNGSVGNILAGQHCENVGGTCTLITDDVINTVCMSYVTNLGTGEQCMTNTIHYGPVEEQAMCEFLTSQYGIVIVDDNNDGSMQYTCNAVSGVVADEIRIDCGNGHEGIGYATSSFTYNCDYTYDENGTLQDNIYDVQCFVDNNTNESCDETMRVDQGFYGICGDGAMDDGEECDLGGEEDEEINIDDYLDSDEQYDAGEYGNNGYYCEDCRIRKQDNTYAYQTPQCLVANTTISVMKNEAMPFWRRLWDRDNLKTRTNYNCEDISDAETKTIIDKDSMECTFVVYNGDDYRQIDEDELNRFTIDCFKNDNSIIFDYFADTYHINFDRVSGKYAASVDTLFDRNVDAYGEYKLILDKVSYDYCDPDTKSWEEGRIYQGVCEVNFALTRPYMMQISTFGIDPVATDGSDFLKDFYDIDGNPLIDSADINDTLDVDARGYGFDSSVLQQMNEFKDRYEPLSIVVNSNFNVRDGKTIGDLFSNAEVKKVPNQLIFFVKGDGNLVLKQLTDYFPGTSYTIYIEGMDVTVVGSVNTNGMIITDQKIYFEDSSDYDYCEKGGQIVQGIFVAKGGFGSLSRLRNQSDQARCQWGNLKIKGVLIGDGLENLMNNRRSHLNEWFQSTNVSEYLLSRERKNEIFEGAALLIEYNPELWGDLPPGAESFTESLDVYRN